MSSPITRVLAAAGSAVLLTPLLALGGPAEAAEPAASTVDGYRYSLDAVEHTATVRGFAGPDRKSIVIPASIEVEGETYAVTGIDDCAFSDYDTYGGVCFGPKTPATSLSLPEGIEWIGRFAFAGNRMRSVVIPSSVAYIGDSAFDESYFTAKGSASPLHKVTFLGDAPEMGELGAYICSPGGCGYNGHASFGEGNNLILYYQPGAEGFASPISHGYLTEVVGTVPVPEGYGPHAIEQYVALDGPVVVGSTLRARLKSWAVGGAFSPKPSHLTFQWDVELDGTWITLGTGKTMTIPAEVQGGWLRMVTVASGPDDHRAVLQLGSVYRILGKFEVRPTVSILPPEGVAASEVRPGMTLSAVGASAAAWEPDADAVRYRWYRGGTKIPGATGAEYVLTKKDRGTRISVVATAKKDGYRSASVTSAKLPVP